MVLMKAFLALVLALVASHACAQGVDAGIQTEDISYSDGGESFTAYLAYPVGAVGRLPVIIHVHDGNGLTEFEKGRVRRTAEELGYVGLGVSILLDSQTSEGPPNNMAVGMLMMDPATIKRRLTVGVELAKSLERIDPNKIAAVGYCLGGMALLTYAESGDASANGLAGIVSFHGMLKMVPATETLYGNTKVLVTHGNADSSAGTEEEVAELRTNLMTANADFEWQQYGGSEHGFTNNEDTEDAHYVYDQFAEERSWLAMADFAQNTLEFSTDCVVAWEGSDLNNLVDETMSYSDSTGAALTGRLFYPPGEDKLPLVVLVHTAYGINNFALDRAARTALEMNVAVLAAPIYTDAEMAVALAATGIADVQPLMMPYVMAPELFTVRLSAALGNAGAHARVDATRTAAQGYCFGGMAVLEFARQGGAASHNVQSVVSFHGVLSTVVADGVANAYNPTRVAVYHGAADSSVPLADVDALRANLESTGTHWEVAIYANAEHGFTNPVEGDDHFVYDEYAERRSWTAMKSFMQTGWEEVVGVTECMATSTEFADGSNPDDDSTSESTTQVPSTSTPQAPDGDSGEFLSKTRWMSTAVAFGVSALFAVAH